MRIAAVLLASTLVVAACGSDDDGAATTGAVETTVASTTATTVADTSAATTAAATTTPPTDAPTTAATTAAPTTTEPATVTPAELAAAGPYAVGVTTRTDPALVAEEAPELIEIWYPTTADTTGATDGYNVRDFLPTVVADLVPPETNSRFDVAARRDAAPAADGPFPVVLFSHGAVAFRTQSSEIARHLASWGMVVASTDHPSRNLSNRLLGTAEGQRASTDDLRQVRTYLDNLPTDDPLSGTLDMSQLALAGHSAGGGTVAVVASDPGIAGYVSYASGLGDAAPDVPSLFMAGALDTIVDPIEVTTAAFEAAPPPSWLWLIDGAGHLAFSDLCAIGGDSTLVDLAESAGIGDLVDDSLRSLATDGCEPPNVPVGDVWPAVNQASTGFLRWVFGIDPEPVGLDASAVTPNVTVQSK
ncbi:MAG: hypothetical protein AAGA42_03090 [Actinomycetota bacterium]